MYCPECGSPNPDNATHCNACNAELTRVGQPIASTPFPPAVPMTPPAPAPVRPKNNAPKIIAIIIGAVVLIGAGFLAAKLMGGSSDKVSEEVEDLAFDGPEVDDAVIDARFTGNINNPDERFRSFDWLSDHEISIGEIAGLSAGDLRILRNAIFAMHGYKFKSADLQEYFSNFAWYSPQYADVTRVLSQTEKNNITTIQRHEGKAPSRTAGKEKITTRLSSVDFTGDYSDIVCYTRLTSADISGLSANELRILRNTIYARHGRRFKDKALQYYFDNMYWYTPTCDDVPVSRLSSTERHNINLIQQMER